MMLILKNAAENAGVDLSGKAYSWMQTYTGKKFYPFAPKIGDVDIEDIAHALSLQCRYAGHCNNFYSVAQHSVLGVWLMDDENELSSYQKLFLMHDAPEAYIGDMIRPMKVYSPAYKETEEAVNAVVMRAFDLPSEMPPLIKHYDNVMCTWEKKYLLPNADEWHNMPDISNISMTEQPIRSWTPVKAKNLFLETFDILFVKEMTIRDYYGG